MNESRACSDGESQQSRKKGIFWLFFQLVTPRPAESVDPGGLSQETEGKGTIPGIMALSLLGGWEGFLPSLRALLNPTDSLYNGKYWIWIPTDKLYPRPVCVGKIRMCWMHILHRLGWKTRELPQITIIYCVYMKIFILFLDMYFLFNTFNI